MVSDDIWAEVYDLFYGDIKEDISFYLDYAREKGSPILEVACGTGRVLIPLAKAGFDTWGVDISLAMLEKASQKISNLPENLRRRTHLIQADMRDFHIDMQFNLVLIPFRSFQLLLTAEDQIQTLENINRHLGHEGTLIIDLSSPSKHFPPKDEYRVTSKAVNPENKNIVIKTSVITYDHSNQLMNIEYLFDEHNAEGDPIRHFRLSAKHRYFFRQDIEDLLKLTSFNLEALYGAFDKKPYTDDSREMIFVARKS